MSALRADLPIVAQRDGGALAATGRPTCASRVQARAAAATRGSARPSRSSTRTTTRRSSRTSNTYRAYYGLPPCTTANGCFKKVNQDGEQGNYPIANPDWEPEIALDTEMVSAICPKCHILLVEANSADEAIATSNPVQHSDLGASVDTAVNLGATEVSNSYGSVGPEPDQTFFDHYYDHPGVAITASAGRLGLRDDLARGLAVRDRGRRHGARPGCDHERAAGASRSGAALFPGVLPNDAQGTGSGCSMWEPKPAWQHDAGCAGRTVADVSAVADNVAIYDCSPEIGGWGVVAGTSIARRSSRASTRSPGTRSRSPTARIRTATRRASSTSRTGSNITPTSTCGYLCRPSPGYDGPTGLGTPNGIGGF